MSDQKKKGVDLENLKTGGFIKERGKDLFTVRLRVPGGKLEVSRMKHIAETAEKHGVESVHLSVRQSLELTHVNYRKFDGLVADLEAGGQKVASCGARVRVPTACGGCAYNPNGLMDTQASAQEVDSRLFGTATGHHKLKVSFSGCPIDCFKSYLNDVGFQGVVDPSLELESCISCGLCAKSCHSGAIEMGDDNKPVFHAENCIYCGDCIKACPTEAWTAGRSGYLVRIGGKGGHNPMLGTMFALFLPAERVVEFIEQVLVWYQEKGTGLGRTRVGTLIEKEGADSLLEHLRGAFPEYVPHSTLPPQIINTQVGKFASR
ncbi:4Fe-4S dicluster domain-containing protein [Geomonas sp.]|uniref:4Fe-4S dicluster domain-containing protein n=1 Tax=Geomonas sp. TaxID=2651584 RepID=UPI002B47401C|nr:4Fe-4S dicluster domain-containing protein [Geomonas sp.]HJV35156.1 4Fe-4S dicluster domain-containing protein [Geomonas sp.]